MPRLTVKIGGRKVGDGQPCYVVAELGQNHQGDVYHALRLIGAAHKAGADAVKLQKRHLASDMTTAMMDQGYSGPHSFGGTYGEHRKALELRPGDVQHLLKRIRYNEWAIGLFVTVCDKRSLAEMETLNCPAYKVASRDLENLPLIDAIASKGKPVILSTGMADWMQIDQAINVVRLHHSHLIVCQCTSQYPLDSAHVNLRAMAAIRERYNCLVGLSDHTVGIHMPTAAAALGACLIEKPRTMSRSQPGTDHAASVEPHAFAKIVRDVHSVQMAMGDGQKRGVSSIDKVRQKLGRSITSKQAIRKGTAIKWHHLTLKSPGTGVPYAQSTEILDHKAARNIPADTTMQLTDVEAVQVSNGKPLQQAD